MTETWECQSCQTENVLDELYCKKCQERRPLDVNAFYYYANQYDTTATTEEDIMQNNRTEEFYAEVENQINEGEIVILNINGKPRMGKSTIAFALCSKFDKTFTLEKVARDQSELQRMITNPDYHHCSNETP